MLVRTALALVVASCALTGRSAKVTPVNFPDGSRAWRIDCSMTDPNECANEAQRLCPAGYQPVGSDCGTLTVRCRADDRPTQPLPDHVAQGMPLSGVTAGQ